MSKTFFTSEYINRYKQLIGKKKTQLKKEDIDFLQKRFEDDRYTYNISPLKQEEFQLNFEVYDKEKDRIIFSNPINEDSFDVRFFENRSFFMDNVVYDANKEELNSLLDKKNLKNLPIVYIEHEMNNNEREIDFNETKIELNQSDAELQEEMLNDVLKKINPNIDYKEMLKKGFEYIKKEFVFKSYDEFNDYINNEYDTNINKKEETEAEIIEDEPEKAENRKTPLEAGKALIVPYVQTAIDAKDNALDKLFERAEELRGNIVNIKEANKELKEANKMLKKEVQMMQTYLQELQTKAQLVNEEVSYKEQLVKGMIQSKQMEENIDSSKKRVRMADVRLEDKDYNKPFDEKLATELSSVVEKNSMQESRLELIKNGFASKDNLFPEQKQDLETLCESGIIYETNEGYQLDGDSDEIVKHKNVLMENINEDAEIVNNEKANISNPASELATKSLKNLDTSNLKQKRGNSGNRAFN